MAQPLLKPGPTQPGTVNPGRKLTVVAAQVAILVSHHREETGPVQRQAAEHPEVAHCRKDSHAAAAGAAVVGTGVLAQAHKMDEVCSFH